MTLASRRCASPGRLVYDGTAAGTSYKVAKTELVFANPADERDRTQFYQLENSQCVASAIRASRKNSDNRTAGGSFSSRYLRLGEHPSDPPHACVSLIPRQAAMANVKRLAQKEKPVVLVWLKIYLIRLLPSPAAELTEQRCKNAHLRYPR
jgi:hypothetical protein